jgi:dTDP-glucose 4,6-dehydratase
MRRSKAKSILVTGGAGFIGSNFILYMMKKYPDYKIINLDKLTYAGNLENLASIKNNPNHLFIKGCICDRDTVEKAMEGIDWVVHFAAESITEDTYVPVRSTPKIGVRMMTFGELWRQQLKKNKPIKKGRGEVILLRGRQIEALSFYNGGRWMPIKAISRHRYKEKVIRIVQKWGAITATPNHSIYAANLELSNPLENPELLAIRRINRIKSKPKKASPGLLEILAAYITEGNATFSKVNGGYIVKIGRNNTIWLENIGQKIKSIFGCNYNITKGKGCCYLQISNKKFYNYLIKNCGKYCDEKMFPNWVFDLKEKAQLFFWNNLLEGGGTKDGRYSTTSYKLANQIGLLLALLGIEYRVFEYNRAGPRKNWKKSWEFKTQLSGNHYGLNKKVLQKIDYNGWVYDLEVENSHNFACGLGNIVCHNTHVDRSITGPAAFIQTNIIGTHVLLEAAKEKQVKRFYHVSTDEVFGSLPLDKPEIKFSEDTPYDPRSPYSASKAAADNLVRAYYKTYGLPIVISNCTNNYGPYHFPEKVIPLFITNALQNKPLPIYGKGRAVRDYLYVTDHCRAIDITLHKGEIGETYCVGGDSEKNGVEVADTILDILNKPRSLKTFVSDRKGHDMRYAMDHTKITRELGWQPSVTFEEGIERTIRWYKDNRKWWERIISKDYLDSQRLKLNKSKLDSLTITSQEVLL